MLAAAGAVVQQARPSQDGAYGVDDESAASARRKDWFWMIAATGVYTYAAAYLFTVYLHWYRAAGLRTFADYFGGL